MLFCTSYAATNIHASSWADSSIIRFPQVSVVMGCLTLRHPIALGPLYHPTSTAQISLLMQTNGTIVPTCLSFE